MAEQSPRTSCDDQKWESQHHSNGPVRLGTESPAVLGGEEGEEWVVAWSAAPSTRDPHLTWVPVGLQESVDCSSGFPTLALVSTEASALGFVLY